MKKTHRKLIHEALDFAIDNDVQFSHAVSVNGFYFYSPTMSKITVIVYMDWENNRSIFESAKKQIIEWKC